MVPGISPTFSKACPRAKLTAKYFDGLALQGNSSLQNFDWQKCDVGEVEEEDEEEEEKTGDTWLNELNPNSQTVITGCMANIHLAKAKTGDR